ncbi:MAG TPA: bL21 family ribosomal protein, partial [Nitrospirota bacterium]
MYAIVETGGKQQRVSTGDVISIEKVEGDKGST